MGAPVRYSLVAEEVTAACRQAGRDPAEVRLVAVSKTVGEGAVSAALAQGARDFAENRPDQLVARAAGIKVERTRIISIIMSTVFAGIGIINYLQKIGNYPTYTAHTQIGMFCIAALLVGGASVE